MYKLASCLIACLVASGCSTYPAIGMFEDNPEIFRGQAEPTLDMDKKIFVSEGEFSMRGEISGTRCRGRISLTRPVESMQVPIQCQGQQGDVSAECSDDRSLNGTWSARSCAIGSGVGQDTNGTSFAFTFGLPEDRAKRTIEKALGISVGESKLQDTGQNK